VGAKEPAVVWHDVNVPDVDSSRVCDRLPIHALIVCRLPIHALFVCHLPTHDCLCAAFLSMFVSLSTRLVLQFWAKWWPTADEWLASIWPLNEWYCNQL
jgi:hypothetical protein